MGYQKLAKALNDSVQMYTPDVLYPRECLIVNVNEDDTLKIKVNIGENIYLDEVRYIGIPKIDTIGLFIPLNNNYDEGYCICYNETTESLTENVIINNYGDSVTEEVNEVKESEEETSDKISNETSEETQTNINYDRRYAKINHTHTENVGTIEDLKTLIKNTKEGNILSLDKNFRNERYGNIIINKKIIIDGNGHSIENISFTCDTNEIELNNIVFFNVTTNRVNGGALQLNGQRISINNCIFYNNIINGTSVYEGGAISVNTSSIETKIVDCYFISNFCSNNGGAIRWIANNGVLIGCKFIGNTATNSGGAIKWLGTNGLIRDCLFENNKSNNAKDILTTDENLMGIGNKFLTESDIIGSEKFYDYITEFDKKEIEDEIHSNFGRNILYDTKEMIVSTPPNNISYTEEFRKNKVVYFDDESSNENGYRDWYYDIATDEFNYNDEFTFSFWVKSDKENIGKVKAYFTGGTDYIKTKVIGSNGYDSSDAFSDGHITFDVNNEWKKCFVTWKLNSTGAKIYKRIIIRIFDGAKIYLGSPKLERGKVATDWTPNPNDKISKVNCICYTSNITGSGGFGKLLKIKNILPITNYNITIGFDVYQKNKKFPVRCYLKFKNENVENFNIDSFYYYGENSDIYIINSKDKEWDLYVKKSDIEDIIEIKNLTINDSCINKENKLEFYPLGQEINNNDFISIYDETDTHSAKAVKSNYCLDKEQTDSYYLSLNGGNLNGDLNVNGNILSENVITKLSTSSTDEEIPSAKAVYDEFKVIDWLNVDSWETFYTNSKVKPIIDNDKIIMNKGNYCYLKYEFTHNKNYEMEFDFICTDSMNANIIIGGNKTLNTWYEIILLGNIRIYERKNGTNTLIANLFDRFFEFGEDKINKIKLIRNNNYLNMYVNNKLFYEFEFKDYYNIIGIGKGGVGSSNGYVCIKNIKIYNNLKTYTYKKVETDEQCKNRWYAWGQYQGLQSLTNTNIVLGSADFEYFGGYVYDYDGTDFDEPIELTLKLTNNVSVYASKDLDNLQYMYDEDKLTYNIPKNFTLNVYESVYVLVCDVNSTGLNTYTANIDYEVKDIVKDTVNNIVDIIYPIGSIYMSVNDVNPNVLFGGQWEQLKNRFLIGSGDVYSNGATGGEATHTLTVSEIPSHRHSRRTQPQVFSEQDKTKSEIISPAGGSAKAVTKYSDYTGGGGSHNNMPPYLAVNIWKRIG